MDIRTGEDRDLVSEFLPGIDLYHLTIPKVPSRHLVILYKDYRVYWTLIK